MDKGRWPTAQDLKRELPYNAKIEIERILNTISSHSLGRQLTWDDIASLMSPLPEIELPGFVPFSETFPTCTIIYGYKTGHAGFICRQRDDHDCAQSAVCDPLFVKVIVEVSPRLQSHVTWSFNSDGVGKPLTISELPYVRARDHNVLHETRMRVLRSLSPSIRQHNVEVAQWYILRIIYNFYRDGRYSTHDDYNRFFFPSLHNLAELFTRAADGSILRE
ncbi:hypothetical protein F53441_5400 [Fusarium austroafricanum]|uniref:Uncharacterized protein n=1 Tax=Fusarium austroafricanum TaxID=2364996 RepID=A0A8H4KKZ8_9HYPO|nr:hypothetical protein F53441_5400 [Fusarium austroafricanum]